MNGNLFADALKKYLAGLVAVCVMLFAPAGTLAWWRGWLLVGILFVPMFVAGLVMMVKAQELNV